MKKYLFVGLSLFMLAACDAGNKGILIPMQHWNNMDVRIETHPNPPLAGMSEVVVIVTGLHGKPMSDLTISLRANPSGLWVQTIQDGYIGVYRRAVDLGNGKDGVTMQVRIKNGNKQKTLLYPIKFSAE
ncbi:MAG: hypothetical protein R8K48_05110 [Gallionella sp.]